MKLNPINEFGEKTLVKIEKFNLMRVRSHINRSVNPLKALSRTKKVPEFLMRRNRSIAPMNNANSPRSSQIKNSSSHIAHKYPRVNSSGVDPMKKVSKRLGFSSAPDGDRIPRTKKNKPVPIPN